MKKIYEYKTKNSNEAVNILRWLRTNGVHDVTYKVRQANYHKLSIEFFDDKLELAYTIQYDWTKRE